MTTRAPVASPVTAYARDVVTNRIVAGRLVKLACQRHLDDLERQRTPDFPYYFDADAAQRAIDFFGYLTLAEGEHAGHAFDLEEWQQFIIGSLFGWKNVADGYRRFITAYLEIGKGNGKSPMAAGVGLYLLVADGEAGAEVYAAAVTRDQAKISFRDAYNMVEASPALSARLQLLTNNIAFEKTNSFFRPVSSEHRGLDGKRVHGALIDEIHEHPTDIVVEKMRAGTKGRRQAMIFEITNSGYDRQSICYEHHVYSEQVLTGALDNETWFAYVCGLDACEACLADGHTMPQDDCADCDDWRDEDVWIKANPNLGVSITWKYLREQVLEAVGRPSKQNIVKRLNFCIWTQSITRWLSADQWELGSVPPAEPLEGRLCYAGLDLSSTSDITSLGLWFPDGDGGVDVLSFSWLPEANMLERVRRDRVPYDAWQREGFIELTEGNVVDYDVIHKRLLELREIYNIAELGMDPWNATQLQTQLMADDFVVVPVRQGFASLTAPSKEFEKLVRGAKLRHNGNPLLRWAASNVVVEHDAAENIKPSKDKSTERIDPIVALVIAGARALVHEDEGTVGFTWL